MKTLIMTLMFGMLGLTVCATDISAQQWELLATINGQPTSGYLAPLGTGKLDFTGDNVPDLFFIPARFPVVIPAEFPVLIIQDGSNSDNKWTLTMGDGIVSDLAKTRLIGFFELDSSNNTKEIVLAEKNGQKFVNPVVLDVDGTVLWDGSNKVLITVANMEADVPAEEEEEEIVVFDPAKIQMEIWGE